MPAPRVCRMTGCVVAVYAPKIICEDHWARIPAPMRIAIADAFVKTYHVDNQPTPDFNRAVLAAVKTVALMDAQKKQEKARSRKTG